MKRILIIGNSPLPNENTKSRPAAGLRTYQFLKPLLKKGGLSIAGSANAFGSEKRPTYKVQLVTIAMPECYGSGSGGQKLKRKQITHSDGFSHFFISKDDPGLVGEIQKIHDEFQPEAIISVNTFPSYIASQLESRASFWADLNGWVMAEGQAQAGKLETNDYLPHYWKMEQSILKRADKFSTVSVTQKFCVTGELASIGRLNSESFGYNFVEAIANGTEWFDGEKDVEAAGTAEMEKAGVKNAENLAALDNIPKDAFVLLWMGGYNTWVDETTLYKGVAEAMEKCEKLYFVSTGGGIKGLDNKTFVKFQQMINQSPFKDRFVFLGWVDTCDIPYIYKRADVGLNVDRKCMETLTGARNRINEMMKFGLPVITTLGSEISYEVERVEAGIGVPSGRHELLGAAICKMYGQWNGIGKKNDISPDALSTYSQNGQTYIKKECNYDKLVRPLLKWLENPRPALDRGVALNLKGGKLRAGLRYIKDNGIGKFLKKLLQKIKK